MDDEREPVDFAYVDADIPAGMTIREWRRYRTAQRLPGSQQRRWRVTHMRRRLTRAAAWTRAPSR